MVVGKSYSSKAIANELIRRAVRDNFKMTHLHLQLMMYFIQSYGVCKLNRSFFLKEFEAWKFGPVDTTVYLIFKKSGKEAITTLIEDDRYKSTLQKDKELQEVIDIVFEKGKKLRPYKFSSFIKDREDTAWYEIASRNKKRDIGITNLNISLFDEKLVDDFLNVEEWLKNNVKKHYNENQDSENIEDMEKPENSSVEQ